MKYKSKLHEWLRNSTPSEQIHIAQKANVKLHYIQRIARGKVKDPGLYAVRRILEAISVYSAGDSTGRFPEITLDDI